MQRIAWAVIVTGILMVSCQAQDQSQPAADSSKPEMEADSAMALTISSSAFDEAGMIPKKYTCDSVNVSPPLSWSGVPDGAQSIALTCDDPDAPSKTWVHWVMYNIPPDTGSLTEGVPRDPVLPNGAVQAFTDFNLVGYGGPCPPSGTHRYYFKLYALDTKLELEGRVTKQVLLAAMEGHVLAEGVLMGRYAR
jgi:Raf kinase inhibitor-like YbhB/YbcL family protein